MKEWYVNIQVGKVSGNNAAEAMRKAKELLESLSESNDGSEMLANAKPRVVEEE